MFEAWKIGVIVEARSQASRVFTQDANAAARANARIDAMRTATARAGAETNRWAVANRTALKGLSVAFDAVGLAAAATFAIGVKGAADLQDAIAQTAVAMGRASSYIDQNFSGLALKMSNRTAQSVTNSMELLRTIATSGINDPAQLRELAMPIALFADTQYLGKNHVAFNDSAAMAAKIAHQFGARTSSQIAPILNSLFKISQDMPDSLSNAATQLKYYAAKYTERGVSPQEVLMLQATADRLGYGTGKSGTGFYQIYRNLLSPDAKQASAQQKLGITGFIDRATGKFDVEGLFNRLNAVAHSARASGNQRGYDELLNRSFTSNAALIAGVLSSNAGRQQFAAVRNTLKRVPDLEVAQAQLLDTLNNQTKRLATNFQSLATILEKPIIGRLTSLVGGAADRLGGATDYLANHPAVNRIMTAAVGAASVWGAYKLFRMVGGMYAFVHMAAHGAREAAGLGGGVYLSRAAHGAAAAKREAGGIGKLFKSGLSGLRNSIFPFDAMKGAFSEFGAFSNRLFVSFRAISGLSGSLTARLGGLRGILWFAGEAALRLGVKFVPVIGWIWTAIDALRYFHDHPKDIGIWVGRVVAFLRDKLWPATVSVLGGWKDAIVSAFENMMKSLLWSVTHMGDIVKDWQSKWADFLKGFQQGSAAPPAAKHSGSSKGPQKTASAGIQVHGPLVGQIVLPPGTPKQHAAATVKHINDAVRTAMRTAGDAPHSPAGWDRLEAGSYGLATG